MSKGKQKGKARYKRLTQKKIRKLIQAVPEVTGGALYSPSTDRMRGTFANEIKHCPHGQPAGKVCAICEPDKFRQEYGWD